MDKYCAICGKPATAEHHLIFGTGLRKIADEDGIYIPICTGCHTMSFKAEDRIHDNPIAEKLSKMLGQALWEGEYIANQLSADDDVIIKERKRARESFRKRYGRSWL